MVHPLQTDGSSTGTDPLTENALGIIFYGALGAIYAGSGWITSAANDGSITALDYKYAGKTVLIGFIAGLVVYTTGDEFSGASYEAALAIAIPIADEVANRVLGPEWGGDAKTTPLIGRGSRSRSKHE